MPARGTRDNQVVGMRHARYDRGPEFLPAQPFLKWAGGKWSLAPKISALLPADVRSRVYREPFVGGGAMFFYLQPERAVLTDAERDLITTYQVVQKHVDKLIRRLERLKATHDEAQFYDVRERYNAERAASDVERAAWLVYLNKTCFNGLYRTNARGLFNVPAGKMDNPLIADAPRLRLAAKVLERAEIACRPFDHLLEVAREGEVVYLDPPYVPLSRTSSFAGYSEGKFDEEDQARLAAVFRELDARGCLLALSNSDTPLVRRLYAGFHITEIEARRAISSKASTRGFTTEVLVRNPKRWPVAVRV